MKKLNEIISTRGRKGTDRNEQIEIIKELRSISKQYNLGSAIDIKILFNLIAYSFDYNTRLSKSMKHETWGECMRLLEEMLDTLMKNENIEISEDLPEENENVTEKTQVYRIRGSILSIFDRLSEEYLKILQQCDAHGTEYVERLKYEPKVCALIDRLIEYTERRANKQDLCHIYLKKVESVYFKYDLSNEKSTLELVDRLCKYIYTNDSTDRLRTKAMLCHIYHNALHDRWFEARDLMLMSHLQESIENADIPLQILYNRTMVQIGLCAFRVGNIKEAHAALLDIQVGNRAKELLAQGLLVQRNVEKSKEQEIKERQRLVPFHMHINLELIECVYLVSAMLIEIPYMCSRDFETKKRLISKQFHYQLKSSERQPVVGPPENMREHVVAASRSMRQADWKACLNYLINDKMNAKVWNLMPQSSNVKVMLTEKVKEESLRTYLFRYSTVYESISVESLAKMFDLERAYVYSCISKMIINEELMASLDEPTQTVVMHRTEPTRLQTLALQLSEKITNLMDQTERMVQLKGGEISAFMTRNQRK
jgi:translation initiation factor 3 subunit C